MEVSLSQAILLAKEGRKLEAGWILEDILRQEPSNELAWLWYADCAETIDERVKILQSCLRYNPQARRAKMGLQILEKGGFTNVLSGQPGLQMPVTGQETAQELSMAFQIPEMDDLDNTLADGPAATQDGWQLSEGAAVFTVSPEMLTEEEFAEMVGRTEALLNSRPELNRRRSIRPKARDDWDELVQSATDWNPVQYEDEPSSSDRGIQTIIILLVLIAVTIILGIAILLQLL